MPVILHSQPVRRPKAGVVSSTYIGQQAALLASGDFSSDLATGLTLNTEIGYDGSASASPVRNPFTAVNSGGLYNLSDWTGKAHWSDERKEWWYSAGTTGDADGSMTLIRYSEADNNWRHWQGSAYTDAGVFGYGQAHNFESSAFDQSREKVYRLLNDTASQPIGVFDVAAKTGSAWTGTGISINSYWASEVFPDVSALCVFYHLGNTTIKRFSLDTGEALSDWTKPADQHVPATCYVGGQLYFTGDAGAFYAKETDGSTTTLASSSVTFNADGNTGTDHTILAHLSGKIYAFKLSPNATGKGIYKYDPALDEWTTMTTTIPFTIRTGSTREQRWMVGAVRSQGCALIITPADDTGFTYSAFLWKP
jgi:hypothetical protein